MSPEPNYGAIFGGIFGGFGALLSGVAACLAYWTKCCKGENMQDHCKKYMYEDCLVV